MTGQDRRQGYAHWLRTGRWPVVRTSDGVELKFNPWHDPADGRFTFAESGRHYGAGGAGPVDRAPRPGGRGIPRRSQIAAARREKKPPEERPVISGEPSARGVTGAGSDRASAVAFRYGPNPVFEFVGGVGEGLYDAARGAAGGVYSALTTNPTTTVRDAGRGIAGMIDTVIAAEDTPARVQFTRGAEALSNASAREIGRTMGSVGGNVALAAAPGAAFAKVLALRRLKTAPVRVTYDPPEIRWVNENTVSEKPWKGYNDSAPGSRPGKSPALMRTLPNGSRRPVKFDGLDAGYVIDRKWKVVDAPHARAAVLRQSDVLTQNREIGVWEVPNSVQKAKAFKLFRKLNVRNIKVRIVAP